jgi:hypothetical protein
VPKENALLLAIKLNKMILNPFKSLIKESSGIKIEERPKTKENQRNKVYIPEILRKKIKYKRKATSPPLKE